MEASTWMVCVRLSWLRRVYILLLVYAGVLMLLFTYLFVFSAACVCCSARVFPVEYNCDTSCSSYTCVTNKTLCQLNTYLRQCGCCHLCVRGNLELCGGLFGRYGVCGKGLRCTVSEKAVLRGEFTGVGICRRELMFVVFVYIFYWFIGCYLWFSKLVCLVLLCGGIVVVMIWVYWNQLWVTVFWFSSFSRILNLVFQTNLLRVCLTSSGHYHLFSY